MGNSIVSEFQSRPVTFGANTSCKCTSIIQDYQAAKDNAIFTDKRRPTLKIKSDYQDNFITFLRAEKKCNKMQSVYTKILSLSLTI